MLIMIFEFLRYVIHSTKDKLAGRWCQFFLAGS